MMWLLSCSLSLFVPEWHLKKLNFLLKHASIVVCNQMSDDLIENTNNTSSNMLANKLWFYHDSIIWWMCDFYSSFSTWAVPQNESNSYYSEQKWSLLPCLLSLPGICPDCNIPFSLSTSASDVAFAIAACLGWKKATFRHLIDHNHLHILLGEQKQISDLDGFHVCRRRPHFHFLRLQPGSWCEPEQNIQTVSQGLVHAVLLLQPFNLGSFSQCSIL